MTVPPENPWKTAYQDYSLDPTPEKLHGVVQALEPTLGQTLNRMGMIGDPLMHSKAKVLAARAIKTFDPAETTQLPTWVAHQMAPLRRFKRLQGQVLAIPEGLTLDAYRVHRARTVLQDKLGRDPDLNELSDEAQLPVKRLRAVQASQFTTPVGGAFQEGEEAVQQTKPTDYMTEALDALYQDADKVDRSILEGRFSAGGTPAVPTDALMRTTGLSPFQLSRRTTALTMKLHRLTADLEKAYAI